MNRIKKIALLAALMPLGMSVAHAGTIFEQNFGCDGGVDSGHGNYAPDQCGAATTPQTWTNPNAPGNGAYTSTNPTYGNTETVFVGGGTRTNEGTPSAFSINAPTTYGPNWNIHDGDDNKYVSGYKDRNNTASMRNDNMSGNMLGTEDENYNNNEANYYQISNLNLVGNATHELSFDFDSWISDYVVAWSGPDFNDSDAFAVAIAVGMDSTNFSLLDTFAAGSDMEYSAQKCDTALGSLTGQACGSDWDDVQGFDGHEAGSKMAGTAIFDLSGFAGQTVSLRFAFASNSKVQTSNSSASIAEGINLDNIKVSSTCITGNEPGCNPPGGGTVPEPTSLALALIGLTAAYRRRKSV